MNKRRVNYLPHSPAIRAVDIFNAAHPAGTPVLVDRSAKLPRTGRTRSLAFIKGGLAAVRVEFLPGIAGTFPLSRVRKAGEAAVS